MRSGLFRILGLCLLGLSIGHAGPGVGAAGQVSSQSAHYDFQSPLVRELKGGEKHSYPISLKADDYLKAVVTQKGIDVVVRLLGPDGKVVLEVDNPNGSQGEEPVFMIAEKAGSYVLEIESVQKSAPAGRYELKPEAIQPATPQDRAVVEVRNLNQEATKLWRAGKYDHGLVVGQQAVEKGEKIAGPEPLLLVGGLNALALIYQAKGESEKAGPLFQRAVALSEQVLGPDHPDVASCLNDLALHYRAKGDFRQAEPLYQRALAIREKAFGPDHPDVAQSLNNLGVFYWSRGEYAKAEPLYQRALAINEKILGPDHLDVAFCLHNLAVLYQNRGDRAGAEPLFLRALAIREKALGPNHRQVAGTLNSLAISHEERRDFAGAESLYQRVLAINEKTLGPTHPEVGVNLNNLANLYRDKGDFTQAEPLYRRSLAIKEKALGPQHPTLGVSLNNLAQLYYYKNDLAQAEPLFQRALSIFEKAFGSDNLEVAICLDNLSLVCRGKGEVPQAIQFQARANSAAERNLLLNLVSGSENQKSLFLKRTEKFTDHTLSLHLQTAPQSPEAMQTALTVVLRRKGRTLDAMTTAIENLRQHQTPEIQKLLDDYASLVGQISVLTLRGPGRKKLEEHMADLKKLETQKDELEKQISAKSAEFKVQVAPITLEQVQQQIPEDGVLVEFVSYKPYNSKTQIFDPPCYAVYTLNHAGTVTWAELGEAAPIEEAVAALRKKLSNPNADVLKDIKPAAQRLDQLVMKPVRALVGNTKHLLLSPDGALNLIPYAALMDEKGKFLVEKYTLTYLTSGRDLLRLGVKIESKQPPLVLADPDFAEGKGPVLVGQQYAPLNRLKETSREGTTLKALFPQTSLKVQAEATVQAVKAVQQPELLHIATHGYFLAEMQRPTAQTGERILLRTEEPLNPEQLRVENPLLRSWLFFAGANQSSREAGKGTLTALEAAQLDLWGTKLVTLSACETGVGETKNGDGVYGLRRALVLAGSEAQMMSLWPVSDQGTRELMIAYYTRLKAGEGRSEALRNVQLKLLKDPKRKHPYYWASFIQSGEWATLAGQRR